MDEASFPDMDSLSLTRHQHVTGLGSIILQSWANLCSQALGLLASHTKDRHPDLQSYNFNVWPHTLSCISSEKLVMGLQELLKSFAADIVEATIRQILLQLVCFQ